MTYLRSYVTYSNDAILDKVDRTTALSLVGAHHVLGNALGHSFGTPTRSPGGQRQSRGLDYYDKPGLAAKFP
jgi:hypothetical protein